MNPSGLSLDQAPPISAPLRFFLTAPLFAILAAMLLAWNGPAIFTSRWNAPLLATTHLITLGFLGLVVFGALLQMLPVIAGTPTRHPKRVAAITHGLVTPGTLLLAAGLAFSNALFIKTAMLFLAAGLAYFTVIVMSNLNRALPGNITVITMRFAVLALGITAVLGLILASNHAWGWWLVLRMPVTNLHLTWGLIGWLGTLVTGVAFQVVPMFQLTPQYPESLREWLAILLFCLLALWSGSLIVNGGSPNATGFTANILLVGGGGLFAVITLYLQAKRRRKLPDVTLSFWRFGMLSVLAASGLWLAGEFYPEIGGSDRFGPLLGIVLIAGFAMSVVNGMLYKIVPFLVWFHLQSLKLGMGNVPNMREILPEHCTRLQMWMHFVAVFLLIISALGVPVIFYLAAFSFGISKLWLWFNILSAYRLLRRLSRGKTKPVSKELTSS
jgi:hypothetical protein